MDRPIWLKHFGSERFLEEADQKLRVALQPIVDLNSGAAIAHEAFVRGYDDLGLPDIDALYDRAASMNRLREMDACVSTKAMTAFAAMAHSRGTLLFINLDGRNLRQWRDLRGLLEFQTELMDLRPGDICIELSERHQHIDQEGLAAAVEGLRKPGFLIAVDDFGAGNLGMQMLYQTAPDFIKLDRFFIRKLANDARKRLLVASIVDIAHTLGCRVIAEGIETVEELGSCREINCDFVQGFFIARPSIDVTKLEASYAEVVGKARAAQDPTDEMAIESLIEDVATLSYDASLDQLFELISRAPELGIIPVVDDYGLPRGAIRERAVKPLMLSRYGRDLARNRSIDLKVTEYVHPIATLDSNTPLAPRLELIADRAGDGVIVTKSLKYHGYLSSSSLVKLANAMRLRQAASQNPLTRLPGNNAIQSFLDRCVAITEDCRLAAYLDIDNFKPFNDKYGFEIGDRAILMMASILKSLERDHGLFVGHIGGDDFFIGGEGPTCLTALSILELVGERFRHAAESLFSAEDRRAGFIVGVARDGTVREFPLLSCTVSAVTLGCGYRPVSTIEMTSRMTQLKSLARQQGRGVLIEHLGAAVCRPAEERFAGH